MDKLWWQTMVTTGAVNDARGEVMMIAVAIYVYVREQQTEVGIHACCPAKGAAAVRAAAWAKEALLRVADRQCEQDLLLLGPDVPLWRGCGRHTSEGAPASRCIAVGSASGLGVCARCCRHVVLDWHAPRGGMAQTLGESHVS